jgi:hypothetical protein
MHPNHDFTASRNFENRDYVEDIWMTFSLVTKVLRKSIQLMTMATTVYMGQARRLAPGSEVGLDGDVLQIFVLHSRVVLATPCL